MVNLEGGITRFKKVGSLGGAAAQHRSLLSSLTRTAPAPAWHRGGDGRS